MAFLFRNRQRNNMELARSAKELTQRLAEEQKPNPKVGCPILVEAESMIANNHVP